jgi:hypothetical protein
VTLKSIAITPEAASVLNGYSQQYTATGTYSDGSTKDITAIVKWISSWTGAATIADGGMATTVALGSSSIFADSAEGISGVTLITVVAAPVTLTSIAVTPAAATIAVGASQQYKAAATFSDGNVRDITPVVWNSTNAAVATINAARMANGVAVGTSTISTVFDGVTGSTTLSVNAAPAPVTGWPTNGTPTSVGVDSFGNVYVGSATDTNSLGYVEFFTTKYTTSGGLSSSWSTFSTPIAIAFDATGGMYWGMSGHNFVLKLSDVGEQLELWELGAATVRAVGVSTDLAGNVYIVQAKAAPIVKATPTGVITEIPVNGTAAGLAVGGPSGNIYVIDEIGKMLRIYSTDGVLITSRNLNFSPRRIAVDTTGNTYVIDGNERMLYKFNAAGLQIKSWSTVGAPSGVAVDAAGNIYVTDMTFRLVRKFSQI